MSERMVPQSEPIDVCVANPWFYPVLVGPGERFRRYAPRLRKRNVHLRAFTVQHEGLSSYEVVDGIPIRRTPLQTDSRRWQLPAFLFELLKDVWQTDRRPDVLQFFNRSYWVAPAVRILRVLGVPCLLVFTLLGSNEGSSLRRRVRKAYRRWIFESFDCIVTSSGVMTQQLREMDVSGTRLEIIPNGVDLERFRPASSQDERCELRQQLGIAPDDEVVVFVGSIFPRKGVDVLVAAWHEVARRRPNARLLLVGPRHEDQAKYQPFRDKVDRLVATSPAPERVVFTGKVGNVEAYLRAADLFVFPSNREGMPNVVPEAMATGLASIVTPFEGLPEEFGRPGREYRLVERTADALADEMLALLNDEEARREMGCCARTWVEQHLDVEKSIDSYAQLYRELAQETDAR